MTFTEFQTTYPIVAGALRTLLVFAVVMNVVPLLIYFERKVCAYIQDRIGPNRVGPVGLLQPLADAIKLALKEDLTPRGVTRSIYTIAPLLVFAPAMLGIAVIPTGIDFGIANFNVGVVFLLTVGSIGVYGLAFGGWASNNKYSLLGGLRASAQMISYEIILGMSLICALMMSGTVDLNQIVRDQHSGWFGWYCFQQPFVALIFLTSIFAETNRLPFDMPECEAELVGGFHTEYSSLKFALFFLGEYVAMISMSCLFVAVFLGGWHVPWMTVPAVGEAVTWGTLLVSLLVFGVKVTAILLLFLWVRWTLPRFRYDQLMALSWKLLLPICLLLIAMTASMIVLGWQRFLPLGNLVVVAVLALFFASRKPVHPPTNLTARMGHRTGTIPESLPTETAVS